jgi:murein DD-endopeptidase MepM/ murein hydrolase activator NlpD
MNLLRWLTPCLALLPLLILSLPVSTSYGADLKQTDSLCPEPALSRVIRHRVAPGETLVSLARRYNLIPATLMGMNPILRNGNAPAGTEILVPPYNGVRVEVPSGRSWRDVATAYGVRADVLFEVNGCQTAPRVVFVPGVNWSPNPTPAGSTQASQVLRGYPLPAVVPVLTGYGWQVEPQSGQVVFSSGVDLGATAGTPVLSVGDGVVAFAESQGNYGNLVVINHNQGLQTRYAHLASISVRAGQTIAAGARIGTVGSTGQTSRPRLHFEVRSNSELGWVAQDPSAYLQNMRVGR